MPENLNPPVKKIPKFYKVSVVMRTGFKYKFVCIERNLQSMLKHTESFYWTESTSSEEISEEEYRAFYNVELDENPKKKTRKKK